MAMTLRIDDQLEQALNDLAAAEGTSKQEVIRRAVLEKHARTDRKARLDVVVNDLLVEYKGALDRLGSV